MNKANALPDPRPGPATAADHCALRGLIKYMSRTLGVGYKEIARDANTNESAVKNYANDKSTTARRAAETYAELHAACAKLVAVRLGAAAPDPYLIGALTHLFGEAWVRSKGLRAAGAPLDEPVDRALGRWAHVAESNTREVEARYRGLWRVVRASTPAIPTSPAQRAATFEPKEINCSLLNIRPREVGGATLCDFRLYYLGRGRRHHERLRFEGYVLPNVDRLEFLGRAENRHDLLSLMVWRFLSNPDIAEHAADCDGLSLALNTSGWPVAARIRAFFVAGSELLLGSEFDALRDTELEKIGVRPIKSSGHVIPAEQLEETVRYLKEYEPIVGFFANQGHVGDE
jgi:hypothetical protein